MSNPVNFLVTYSIFEALLCSLFVYLWLRERKRSARRLNGMREWREIAHGGNRHNATEWREIAFHHAREKKAEAKRTKFFEESCGRLLTENQDWSEQFRHLVVTLWGDPPLDRSVMNVCEFVGELKDKAVKLTAAYVHLSDRLRDAEARLTSCGAEKQRMEEDAANLSEQLHRFKKAICDLLASQELRDRWQAMDIETIVREIVIGPQEPHQCRWEQRGTGSFCSVCGATCPF